MNNENINENSVENWRNNVDKDAVKNLTSNLMNNENSLDLNSINDTLMKELGRRKKNSILPVSKASEQQENTELSSLSQKLENIANDISELKKELQDVREQNSFTKFFTKIFKNSKK
jgi:hypothetical protein